MERKWDDETINETQNLNPAIRKAASIKARNTLTKNNLENAYIYLYLSSNNESMIVLILQMVLRLMRRKWIKMRRNETIKFAMDCFVAPPLARLLAMTNEDCDTPLAPDTKAPLLAMTCMGFFESLHIFDKRWSIPRQKTSSRPHLRGERKIEYES